MDESPYSEKSDEFWRALAEDCTNRDGGMKNWYSFKIWDCNDCGRECGHQIRG